MDALHSNFEAQLLLMPIIEDPATSEDSTSTTSEGLSLTFQETPDTSKTPGKRQRCTFIDDFTDILKVG